MSCRGTQSIAEDLFPLTHSVFRKFRTVKKMDLALAIIPEAQSQDALLLKVAFKDHGPPSPMTDAHTRS